MIIGRQPDQGGAGGDEPIQRGGTFGASTAGADAGSLDAGLLDVGPLDVGTFGVEPGAPPRRGRRPLRSVAAELPLAPGPEPAAPAEEVARADAPAGAGGSVTTTTRPGRLASARSSPLVRKVTGYSAGSVIAAFTSELAFAGSFGALHVGTTLASLIGFLGGAVPNYVLNRRWAWKDQGSRSRRDEILLYAAVSIASFAASAVVTAEVEHWARSLTHSHGLQVVLVAASYLAVAGVFFVGKFVAYELIVFTKGPGGRGGSGGRRRASATRSTTPPS